MVTMHPTQPALPMVPAPRGWRTSVWPSGLVREGVRGPRFRGPSALRVRVRREGYARGIARREGVASMPGPRDRNKGSWCPSERDWALAARARLRAGGTARTAAMVLLTRMPAVAAPCLPRGGEHRARAPSPFPMGTMIPCSCPVVLAWMPLPLVWQCHEHILHGGHELAGGGSTEPRAADAFPDEPRRPDRGPPAPRRWDHWQGWLRRMHGDHRSPRARQVSLRARGAAVGGLGCHRGRSVLRPRVSLLPRVGRR